MSIKINTGELYFMFTLRNNEAIADVLSSEVVLIGNYPNPFNPSTTIRYDLPHPENVRLEIFNVRGQIIKTLVNEPQEAGRHGVIWHGTDNNGRAVTSGVYFYRLTTDSVSEIRRMLLLK